MGKVRVDVTGYGDEFSQQVEVDTDRVVSSIKVNVADHEITVNYKRVDSGDEPLKVEESDEVTALTGVVAPVDERVTADDMKAAKAVEDANRKETDLDEKGTAKSSGSGRGKARATANTDNGTVSDDKNSAVDPDGNTAKVKTDETKLDS